MKPNQNVKRTMVLAPTAATVATTTTTGAAYVDTQGYGRCRVTVLGPVATNTSGLNAPLLITILHDSTTAVSNASAFKSGVVGTTLGTSDFTQAADGNTEGFNQVIDFSVSNAERYLFVKIAPTTANTHYSDFACIAECYEGNGPNNALTEVI